MYLGLDVGGSRCRWEWWPQDAAPGGDADGAQPVAPGVQAVGERLATALAAATRAARRAPIAAVCATAGVGDASTAAAVADALRARGVAFPVAVTGDVLAAAAAGLADGPGVLLWSGTGSFAIARDAAGALHRVGGRGFLLGDQGSGYDLVRRAAAAALLAADDLGPPTALGEALVAAFAAPSLPRLGAVVQRCAPGEVAARLPVVLATAAAGDAVANDLLAAGADGLAMLAAGAARRGGLDLRDVTVTGGGGVLLGAAAFAALVRERLAAFGVAALPLLDERAAAVGAARLAADWYNRREPQYTWVTRVTL